MSDNNEKLEYTSEEFAELVYNYYGARFANIAQKVINSMRIIWVILGVVLMVIAGLGLPISIIFVMYDVAHGMEVDSVLWEAAKVCLTLLSGGVIGLFLFMSNA